MPLKCLDADGTTLLAHQLTRDEFEALRTSQKVRQSLHFACCTARVGLRVSKSGLNHFYHLSGGGGCPYEEETEAHLSLKVAVMEAARRVGWQADCEVSGGLDERSQWRADVLAWRGAVKVAFEAQISNATWAQVVARQARYRAAGVRGLWLLGQDSYQVCNEVPAFQVRDDGEGDWMVRISPPKELHNVCVRAFKGNWLTLDSFIQGALTKNLVWAPVLEFNRVDIIVRASPHPHCACGARLLLPTSLAVSLPYPGYRSLLWTVTPSRQLKANPGPAWLNNIARLINRAHPEKSGALIATRETRGRAYHFYQCPSCGAEIDGEPARNNEIAISRTGIPVHGVLPEAQPESAEWDFIYQWWCRTQLQDQSRQQDVQMHLQI